jgi:hypothetical protein
MEMASHLNASPLWITCVPVRLHDHTSYDLIAAVVDSELSISYQPFSPRISVETLSDIEPQASDRRQRSLRFWWGDEGPLMLSASKTSMTSEAIM